MNKYSKFGNKAGKVRVINTVIAVAAVIVIGGAGFMAVKTAKPKFEDFKEQMAEKKAEREEAKKKAEAEKAEAAKKAEEEKKAAAEAESEAGAADTSEENVPAEPVAAATLYSAWSERLASAEQEDAQILASKPSDGEFYGSMAAEQSRYDLWDGLLNEMWQDLKGTLGSGEMEALTNEQIDWIHQKEAMVADYWNSQNVDYSAFPNAPASETTKTRVYYLLERCPG